MTVDPSPNVSAAAAYEPPALLVHGTVHELTLTFRRCWWGKEWGGSDGFEFMGIDVSISNCSA